MNQTQLQCLKHLITPAGLNLQVKTAMLAGTLILLLMTANTLMLYSKPGSSPEIVQAVVLPGILISICTPDRETGKKIQ